MKRATKMVALLLSAAMMVGLTACGVNAADDTAASSDTQETTASGDTATDDDMIYFAAVGPRPELRQTSENMRCGVRRWL